MEHRCHIKLSLSWFYRWSMCFRRKIDHQETLRNIEVLLEILFTNTEEDIYYYLGNNIGKMKTILSCFYFFRDVQHFCKTNERKGLYLCSYGLNTFNSLKENWTIKNMKHFRNRHFLYWKKYCALSDFKWHTTPVGKQTWKYGET